MSDSKSQPNEDLPAMNWPNWIAGNADLLEKLNSISATHQRLKASIAGGHEYQHPFQKQVNALIDRQIASGSISKSDDGTSKEWRLAQPLSVTADDVAALIYQNGRALQIFDTLTFCGRLAVAKQLDGAMWGLKSDDLLVPFGCLRGVIEHVAHYHGVIQKLLPLQVPDNFDAANRSLMATYEVLVKAAYGTRIDWESLFASTPDDTLDQEELKYERGENRADREARSIMTPIDSLSKTIRGTRAVYGVLCEFVHPNVGNLMAFTETAEISPNSGGVVWIKKRISSEVPEEFLKSWSKTAQRVFYQIDRCLLHFEKLLSDSKTIRETILKTTQNVVRNLVASNRGVIDPYAPCPCGYGKKLKFCCGA